jgi:glycosyltransferase involved in cell wall biosynthesis
MKIIISATTSWNLYNSRLNLIKTLTEHEQDVVLLSPHDKYSQTLLDLGYHWENWPLEPRGTNLLKEFRSLLFLFLFYRNEQPDIVHHFTPKGVVYGSFAAKLAGVNRIYNTITGLGYAFSDKDKPLLKELFLILYPLALAKTQVIFQNPENKAYFLRRQITRPDNSALIRGSGVDINRFKFTPEPKGPVTVMLSSRFVEEKGLMYFIDAARILHKRKPSIRFVLVGEPEPDQPSAIPDETLAQWEKSNFVDLWGWQENMEAIYPKAHIVCLPTYYSEGVPKALIEAAACGRPLIATDTLGCREIVQDKYNGILVPPKNSLALANSIELLVSDSSLRKKMGENSRRLAVDNFSTKKVDQAYLELYNLNDEQRHLDSLV